MDAPRLSPQAGAAARSSPYGEPHRSGQEVLDRSVSLPLFCTAILLSAYIVVFSLLLSGCSTPSSDMPDYFLVQTNQTVWSYAGICVKRGSNVNCFRKASNRWNDLSQYGEQAKVAQALVGEVFIWWIPALAAVSFFAGSFLAMWCYRRMKYGERLGYHKTIAVSLLSMALVISTLNWAATGWAQVAFQGIMIHLGYDDVKIKNLKMLSLHFCCVVLPALQMVLLLHTAGRWKTSSWKRTIQYLCSKKTEDLQKDKEAPSAPTNQIC